ncbi:MAG TPA: hypothetical protein VIS74_02020, partial [Chthoniobacterales bacterium]
MSKSSGPPTPNPASIGSPRIRLAGLLGLLFLTAATAWPATVVKPLKPLNRSVSPSRQFVVYCADAKIRLPLTALADDAAVQWQDWLGEKESWKTPIILNFPEDARGRARPGVRTTLAEADGGQSKVQVDIQDPSLAFSPELRAEIFRALALEYSYRGAAQKSGKSYRLAPDWLAEGLAEEMRSRQDGVPARVVEGLLNAPKKPSVMDLLRGRPPTL